MSCLVWTHRDSPHIPNNTFPGVSIMDLENSRATQHYHSGHFGPLFSNKMDNTAQSRCCSLHDGCSVSICLEDVFFFQCTQFGSSVNLCSGDCQVCKQKEVASFMSMSSHLGAFRMPGECATIRAHQHTAIRMFVRGFQCLA